MDAIRVKVEPIAGEAPWQMGRHSKHLKILEEMVLDFLREDTEISMEEAIDKACTVKNERHIEWGYSPSQWFLGDQSNPVDSVLVGNTGSTSSSLSGPGDHRLSMERRWQAGRLFIKHVSSRALKKAALARTRPLRVWNPGDLVYFWRQSEKSRGHGHI